MSLSQPPQKQPTPAEIERYRKTAHNVALAMLVACPVLALLPPRKMDFYTIGLIATTGYCANFLVRERSGRSIAQYVTRQTGSIGHDAGTQSVVGELQKEGRSSNVQDYRSGWKAQRQKEIREDVEEGKSFTDMIIDQIWEVWNQGKVEEEDE